MIKQIALLVLLLVGASQAHAGLELRAHYGMWNGTPKDWNAGTETFFSGWPDAKGPSVLGADVLYVVPVLGVAGGLRYETFKETSEGDIAGGAAHVKQEFKGSRTSLLAGYRFFN